MSNKKIESNTNQRNWNVSLVLDFSNLCDFGTIASIVLPLYLEWCISLLVSWLFSTFKLNKHLFNQLTFSPCLSTRLTWLSLADAWYSLDENGQAEEASPAWITNATGLYEDDRPRTLVEEHNCGPLMQTCFIFIFLWVIVVLSVAWTNNIAN